MNLKKIGTERDALTNANDSLNGGISFEWNIKKSLEVISGPEDGPACKVLCHQN